MPLALPNPNDLKTHSVELRLNIDGNILNLFSNAKKYNLRERKKLKAELTGQTIAPVDTILSFLSPNENFRINCQRWNQNFSSADSY